MPRLDYLSQGAENHKCCRLKAAEDAGEVGIELALDGDEWWLVARPSLCVKKEGDFGVGVIFGGLEVLGF